MKSKSIKFEQHLYHEIDDEEKAEEYVDAALPLIGHIVMHFNGLESALDTMLCEIFTDRSDSTGLIVLNKMNYSAKVDLFKRFNDDFHIAVNHQIDGYDKLINNLRETGRLRNLVVHADWENTDGGGYTYIKIKISKQGMNQEYLQFTEESLYKIIDLIFSTRMDLSEYWDTREDVLNDN